MQSALTTFFMPLFVLLCLLGILANGFIVLVLSREWLRRGRLLPLDMILISLGASRFCLQWVGLLHSFYYFFHLLEYPKSLSQQFFGLHWHFLNSATFWFGTLLGVLFCLKIANITHPAFLWLKWRFPGSVPRLLLGSVLVSLVVTLLFFWGNHTVYQGSSNRKFSGNMTHKQWKRRMEIHYFLPLKLVTLSIPCFIFLVSNALLINSLRRHTRRMQHSTHFLQDPNTQAHTAALKSLVSFLVLYALAFVSLIIETTGFFTSESQWYWPWQIIIYLSTSLHPFVLIFNNIKLRGMFGKLLLLARGFWVA
ncbi:PREDICTED: taste receptor type 2 member 41-like [Propithecus coquereli]|uniref:taste receptor type 2 member 41-like n=1 Tax=Propithecus coquereli TaxID=379532 RepID=UPI00063F5CA6|nr:PREDICTED: taste receptor type 2 member 41-like [Propithecus coquereli]